MGHDSSIYVFLSCIAVGSYRHGGSGAFAAFKGLSGAALFQPYSVLAKNCCGSLRVDSGELQCVAVCCSLLQCVAVCCSVLQYVVVCCVFICIPSLYENRCGALRVDSGGSQCVAACCNMLQ